MPANYDAVLLISYGGPESPDDVLPFLENVVRGKDVPRERLLEVAHRYEQVGGASPINAENRALLRALVTELNAHGPPLPVYWGNRNWHPFIRDTLGLMAEEGIRRALAFVTSAYSSYTGCRQYLEDIENARSEIGPDAPRVDKLRGFYNHPGFIEPMAEGVTAALERIPAERRSAARIICTAHSLPVAMAAGCEYEEQLREACRLVGERVGKSDWELAYQSRSGPPSQPWLGPDVFAKVEELAAAGNVSDAVIVPVGFVCEHMELVYDLDVELRRRCEELGINMIRSAVPGCHPRFVRMIRELIEERIEENPARVALGTRGPLPDVCPPDCCPRP